MPQNPYIRDEIVLDAGVQEFILSQPVDRPVYLLARRVTFASGQDRIKAGGRTLVVMADEFDGTGGVLDASGENGTAVGGRGDDGPAAETPLPGRPWRPKAGSPGKKGGAGQPGGAGGAVTLYCRRSNNLSVTVAGGRGAAGGPGGNGGRGVNGYVSPSDPENASQLGSAGGGGGRGGDGGAGGAGGQLSYFGLEEPIGLSLAAGGGVGGPGGSPGNAGIDGVNTPQPEAPIELPEGWGFGKAGVDGAGLNATSTLLSHADFVKGMRSVLNVYDVYANFWAPFRLEMGRQFYRQFQPGADTGEGVRAAGELLACLEFQPDNVEGARLLNQLAGAPEAAAAAEPERRRVGGLNVLGLPRNYDMIPLFEEYQRAFTSFAALDLHFVSISTDAALMGEAVSIFGGFADEQARAAEAAATNASRELGIATSEAADAVKEVEYRQQQADRAAAEIKAAMEELERQRVELQTAGGSIWGTLAGIAGAVVSVVAAIPTAGTSLVGLVPSMIALTKTVVDNAEPIGQALFAGEKPDLEVVTKAGKEVGKEIGEIVKAGQAVVNLVDVIRKISAVSTSDNAKQVALVKEGAEAAHELLLAQRRAGITQQRVEAVTVQRDQATALAGSAASLRDSVDHREAAVRSLAYTAVQIAGAKMEVLLTLAFKAQRAAEIITLRDETRSVLLDAGSLGPDVAVRYLEGQMSGAELANRMVRSWSKLMEPIEMERRYLDFISDPNRGRDVLRLSFTDAASIAALKNDRRFAFRVETLDFPEDRVETKARNIAVAFIGASLRNDVISCDITHGSRYEQMVASDQPVHVAVLQPRTTTSLGRSAPLETAIDLDTDFADTKPAQLAFWGRGAGGDYAVAFPREELAHPEVSFESVTEVQVWIGYQFLRRPAHVA